jgi:hypothetical protein
MRQRLGDAQANAAEARRVADDASADAASAQSQSNRLRGELEQCRGEGGAGDGRHMPMMGAYVPDAGAAHGGEGFHLLDNENPSAPLRDDGHQGWFYPGRVADISAVVLHTAHSLSPGAGSVTMDVADAFTKAGGPSSMHGLAGPDGVVELLPDDYTAFHAEGANRTTLGLEVVFGRDEEEDEEALEQAAAWFAQKARTHGIPLRRISRDEFLAGGAGIIGHSDLVPGSADPGEGFPWERFLDLADRSGDPPLPVGARIPLGGASGPDPCAELSQRSATAAAEAETAATRSADAGIAADHAEATLEEEREALWDCECRVPTHQVPTTPEEEEPERRRDKWYLLEHENPHAKVRGNGKRGHYHEVRGGPIRGIVVHTGESYSANAVADYFANVRRPAAAHVVIDPHGWVKLLPDRMAAFHARGGNEHGLGMVMAYTAADWGSNPVVEEAIMRLSAAWCGIKARAYGIPIKRITAAEWEAGERGFVAHSDIDPSHGSDPGPGFDWERFLETVSGMGFLPGGKLPI